jgi:hypothetical protein
MTIEDVPLRDPIAERRNATCVVDLDVCLPVPPGVDLDDTWAGDGSSALAAMSPLVLGLAVARGHYAEVGDASALDALMCAIDALLVALEASH